LMKLTPVRSLSRASSNQTETFTTVIFSGNNIKWSSFEYEEGTNL
jgi:hypothetical protein